MSTSRTHRDLRSSYTERRMCDCWRRMAADGYGPEDYRPVTCARTTEDGNEIVICWSCARDYDRWVEEENRSRIAAAMFEAYGDLDVIDTMSGGSYVRGW